MRKSAPPAIRKSVNRKPSTVKCHWPRAGCIVRSDILAFLAIVLGWGYVVSASCSLAGVRSESKPLFPIIHNRRFGFVDANGTTTISPQFLWASEFSEGRAAIFACHRFGYIDDTGKIVIDPQFDWAGRFSEGLAPVKIGARIGFIDAAGRMVIPARYESTFDFSGGLVGVFVDGHEGVIDRSGGWVVKPEFDELLGFSQGLSAALRIGRWGYVDKSGKAAIDFRYKAAGSFTSGRAVVTTDGGEESVIDQSGRIVIRNVHAPWGFSEGLAPAQIGEEDMYRYIDVNGHVIVPGPFETALAFAEGTAPVEKDDKWGFIDRSGKFVIEPKFDNAERFSNGLASVRVGGKWGIIDRSGAFVVQPQFDEILGPPGDFDQVSISKDEWGYIDPNGRLFWRAPQSERPLYFEHNPMEGLSQQDMEENCRALERN